MSYREPRLLHVANGSCTTSLIHAAGIPGALSIWADPLHDGPVPGGLTDDELLELRKTVSLICIGSFPGHPGFKGLGELTPGELASLPTPVAMF